jgi:phenylacetate-coenzyme A ligase PaaK-like adenylate-forming protein
MSSSPYETFRTSAFAGLRFQTFDQMHQLPIWSKSDARCRVPSGAAPLNARMAIARPRNFAGILNESSENNLIPMFVLFRRNGHGLED